MKIRIEIESRSVTATLNGSEAARDFASLLPLTMTLEDYASTEKIANLPRKLSTRGANTDRARNRQHARGAATGDLPGAYQEEQKVNRPYVIIHTHTSIDGNIDTMDLPEFETGSQHYQDIALAPGRQVLEIDAYLNGKTSTEVNITHYKVPDVDEQAADVPAGDFLAEPDMDMYYISIDPRGELAWESNTFGYGGVQAHFIEVLTEAASNAYKDFLRRKRVSYIIAGREQVDYEVMLTKLHELGIQRLMVGGGGAINWSFLQSGLVDEVSMVLSPIANGDPDAPRFFTAREPYSRVSPVAFRLTSVEDLGDSVVWLRYTVQPGARSDPKGPIS